MQEEIKIPVVNLCKENQLPAYTRLGDSALDLRAAEALVLKPFQRAKIRLGISLELPNGYCALVLPRSGLALDKGLSFVNSPGLIDSNFRGEICALVINLDPEIEIQISKGDRIAQLLIIAFTAALLEETDEIGKTNRSNLGFGSSGIF